MADRQRASLLASAAAGDEVAFRRIIAENHDSMRRVAAHVTRVNSAISGRYGVPGVKAAMALAGYDGGIPRRPLLPLDEAEVAALRSTLEAEGVL